MEFDELQTGQRREGLFYGFMVFAQKLGIGLGLFLVGAILDAQGFQSPQPGQDAANLTQPASAIFAIRTIIGPVPAVMLVVGMLFTWKYPITREKHAEIQATLANREQAGREEPSHTH
jgi:GPH family glycoside/pentoside/hexuronide:cation symporter